MSNVMSTDCTGSLFEKSRFQRIFAALLIVSLARNTHTHTQLLSSPPNESGSITFFKPSPRRHSCSLVQRADRESWLIGKRRHREGNAEGAFYYNMVCPRRSPAHPIVRLFFYSIMAPYVGLIRQSRPHCTSSIYTFRFSRVYSNRPGRSKVRHLCNIGYHLLFCRLCQYDFFFLFFSCIRWFNS